MELPKQTLEELISYLEEMVKISQDNWDRKKASGFSTDCNERNNLRYRRQLSDLKKLMGKVG